MDRILEKYERYSFAERQLIANEPESPVSTALTLFLSCFIIQLKIIALMCVLLNSYLNLMVFYFQLYQFGICVLSILILPFKKKVY